MAAAVAIGLAVVVTAVVAAGARAVAAVVVADPRGANLAGSLGRFTAAIVAPIAAEVHWIFTRVGVLVCGGFCGVAEGFCGCFCGRAGTPVYELPFVGRAGVGAGLDGVGLNGVGLKT